jgi:ELWxxDGT repeat protein
MKTRTGFFARATFACLLAGTASAGTVGLVKDINTQEVISSTSPWYLGVAGGRAIFSGEKHLTPGLRLFRTDGTAAGTAQIAVTGLVQPTNSMQFGDRLLFFASPDENQTSHRLWITDGTDAGTITLLDTVLGTHGLLAANDTRAFFCAVPPGVNGCDIYVTNGTPAGTQWLTDSRGVGAVYLAPNGDLYFFSGRADGSQRGLWVSDGTPAGTRELYTFAQLNLSSTGEIAWVDGRTMYVNGDDAANQRGLFSINLDTGTTEMLTPNDYTSSAENAVELGGLHYFIMDFSLWRSDGTPAGTERITTNAMPYNAVNPLVRIGNRLVFVNGDPVNGNELWVSDGTEVGTTLLVDASPGTAGYTEIATATADRVFFVAGADSNNVGGRFWVSDGTSGGTHAIATPAGSTYANFSLYKQVFGESAVVGSHVFMSVEEQNDALDPDTSVTSLWMANLTGTAISRVSLGSWQVRKLGDRVVYSAEDETGREPWVSDGTPAGTMRITDLAVSGQTGASMPQLLEVVGDRVYFMADDGVHGAEPWVSDGTADGTRMLRDIMPGPERSDAGPFLGIDDLVFFSADDDPAFGPTRLWRSDGTESGTIKLNSATSALTGCGRWATKWNGRVYYFATPQGFGGAELWSTDGTASGTRMEVALPGNVGGGNLCDLTVTSTGLVFTAQYFQQSELWRTDGTPGGTYRLGSFEVAESGSWPALGSWLTAVDGLAYFMAFEPAGAGRELWRTDGTSANTAKVSDIVPGVDGAGSASLTRFGNGVMLAYESTDGQTRGLYRVSGPGGTAELVKDGVVGNGGVYSIGTKVFFVVSDDTTESLWVSDGTTAGSHSVLTGELNTFYPYVTYAPGDGFLFFHGILEGADPQIYVTNGETGVHALSDFTLPYAGIGISLPLLNNRPVFAHEDIPHSGELWTVTNQAPVAVADTASVLRDTSVVIPFLANDSDADSDWDIVVEAITTQPAHGTLAREAGGWRFTPTAGYTGSDFFEYQLTDELDAQSAVTRVTITVSAPPPPPPPPPPPAGSGSSGGKKGGGGALDLLGLAGLFALLWHRRRFA